MTSDRRRSELEGSQLCAASFYLVIIMTSNLLNLTHTTQFSRERDRKLRSNQFE
jgi:hypothetical protein